MNALMAIGHHILDRIVKFGDLEVHEPYAHAAGANGEITGYTLILRYDSRYAHIDIYPWRTVIASRDYATDAISTEKCFEHDIRSPDFNVDKAVHYIYRILPKTSPCHRQSSKNS